MTDAFLDKFARILVDYSTDVKPGDRVAITASTSAEPLVQEIYKRVLTSGGYPHVLFDLNGQEEIIYSLAKGEQLDFVSQFHKLAFEQFEVVIKIRSEINTRSLSSVDLERQSRRQKALFSLIQTQMQRGADRSLRWVSTIYPTSAYAMEADMGDIEYKNFFYRAIHADENTSNPVAHWNAVKKTQDQIIKTIEGHDKVELKGPNVELSLSIQGRTFCNGCGEHNMPDGEIYTGPVEDSVNGWVRYSYPSIYQGREVDGIELWFEAGKVIKAHAQKNQDLLLKMLDTDAGSRYLGEFAIGTNMEIDRFTSSILLDEKIGGSFHTAIGAGYPETGSNNKSKIHWDMICDMRKDAQILVDGEIFYKNGAFLI